MPDVLEIDKDDTACYWVFDPKNFSGKPAVLNLNVQVFFTSGSKHPYHMSVNSRKLCDIYPDRVHEMGVSQAERLTERHKANGKNTVETYTGFLKSQVEDVEKIQYDDHRLKVEHDPIDENHAHCNIVLKFPNRKPNSSKRNLMADDLKNCFGDEIEKP